ncbi:hypothetical protein HNR42_002054 [Deinobacterium chartae]|uniref:Uncharacterized protein n=1 Tax=Deinobacterium chartae TaxID=521158 RepID=A0A841I2L2_9DEIO|nr:hypothetical protein [Deinobacterium chartae]MBB6098619.1 hypothetical protein [Deinobacterium chartae]
MAEFRPTAFWSFLITGVLFLLLWLFGVGESIPTYAAVGVLFTLLAAGEWAQRGLR